MSKAAYDRQYFSLANPDSNDYRHITARPVALALGAEITGVDLSRPCEPAVYDEIADALWRHHVLFFRDQDLPPASHMALATHFGVMERHEIFKAHPSHPEISVLENDETKPPEINVWHTDVTFRERPTLCSILYCVETPEVGGDTLWLNQQAAYATLSPKIRKLLLDLEAEHDVLRAYAGSTVLENAGGAAKVAELRAKNPPVLHPVVVSHPITGVPGLLVSRGFTSRIAGLSRIESDGLIGLLLEHLATPEFQVRFHWRPGSIAIWDNFATQHYAMADYYPRRRLMRRITVSGRKPEPARSGPEAARSGSR